MTDYDPLNRLGLTEIVEDFGLAILPRLTTQGNPNSPRLAGVLPGDGLDLERVESAILVLEATLNAEQQGQLTTIVAGLCAHLLDAAAGDILEAEARDKRASALSQSGNEWKRHAPPELLQLKARAFAIAKWRAEPTIRIGTMALMVTAHLISLELKPPGLRQLRKILVPCATAESRKRGRPRLS